MLAISSWQMLLSCPQIVLYGPYKRPMHLGFYIYILLMQWCYFFLLLLLPAAVVVDDISISFNIS